MKTLEFIYQETQIHFLINPTDKNVMVNATEMAKLFNKKTKLFLKSDHAKAFIKALERTPNGGRSGHEKALEQAPNGARSDHKIIDNRGHVGIYFDRRLALKFAAWLDVNFEVWVYKTIEEITFGNYKKHWEAHAQQENAKLEMANLKKEMLLNPTTENVHAYFEAEANLIAAKQDKTKAIRNQLKMFDNS